MLDKISEFIFRRIFERKGSRPDKSIMKKLEFLYPSEDSGKLYREFCIRRIKLTLVTVLAGMILGCFMKISAVNNRSIPDLSFERNEWDGKKQKLELYAISDEGKLEIDVTLDPRIPGTAELDHYSERLEEEIPLLIRGDNPDTDHVSTDLILSEKYEGYPFKCVWRSSDPARISAYGGRVDASEEGTVILTLEYSYGSYAGCMDIPVRVVCPGMTGQQAFETDLEKYLTESQDESREEKVWNLPAVYSGSDLTWEYRVDDDSGLLMGVFATVGVAVYLAAGKDLTSRSDKKTENLRRSYPKILRQLALYTGAGMTVKAAFTRIAEDGPKQNDECVYEEMRIACLEMNRGISESLCYERFGKRTGLGEYIKLSGLLSQNLKRGSAGFAARLKEEAFLSMHERLLESRKAGEKAQTKLLAPMMIMLAVVMVMIMIPAMTGIKI